MSDETCVRCNRKGAWAPVGDEAFACGACLTLEETKGLAAGIRKRFPATLPEVLEPWVAQLEARVEAFEADVGSWITRGGA